MARNHDEPLTKHTLWLHEGDFEKLRGYYPELGSSVVVRKLVRAHIRKIEAAASGETAMPDIEVNL